MKKTVKVLAFAFAAMALTVACNNNAPEEVIDTTPVIDTTVVEEVIDTTPVVEEPVVEEPVKKATNTVKKATTPKEDKTAKKKDDGKLTLSTRNGEATATLDVTKKKDNGSPITLEKVTVGGKEKK